MLKREFNNKSNIKVIYLRKSEDEFIENEKKASFCSSSNNSIIKEEDQK